MNGWPTHGWLRQPLLIVIVLAALLYGLPFALGPYWQQLGFRALQLLTLAIAWNLLAGYGGQVSLGTGAFVGLGAYAFTLSGNQLASTLPLQLAIAGLVAGGFAALASVALFRLRGLYFTIGTLALAEALRILMVNLRTFGGASGIVLHAATPPFHQLYWLALGIAALAVVFSELVLRSPLSLSLRAVRDDEEVALQMGVRSFRVKLGAFVLAAVLMGLAGGLQALKLGVIEPYGAFGMSWTIDTVAVVIIGGLGTRMGPLLGTLIYVVLGEMLRNLPELHGAVTGVFLLLAIRFAPRGVWSLIARRRVHA